MNAGRKNVILTRDTRKGRPALIADYCFEGVCDISAEFLASRGITALILDVDNTLTHDHDSELPAHIAAWLRDIESAGVRAVIVSNNDEYRVKPFALECRLPFIAKAGKPLRSAFDKARAMLNCEMGEIAVIGDQLFTDMALARAAGCIAIFVEPMGADILPFVRFKRALERPFMKHVRRRSIDQ